MAQDRSDQGRSLLSKTFLVSLLVGLSLCLWTIVARVYDPLLGRADFTSTSRENAPHSTSPDVDGKFTIVAPGIRILFVPYGASVANLFINDSRGIERDVVVGFDNASYYTQDQQHGHWGSVPGRYANRIKNATFSIDGLDYHTDANENGGLNTLHGGADGWDYRNLTVVAHTTDSITFSIVDPDGKEGFPGEVISYITYTVAEMAWHIKMTALATTRRTPIMLSSHTYWNLDGFQNDATALALNHSLHLPYSRRRIDVDNILIPTGKILPNARRSVNDFWTKPKQVGASLQSPEADGNCGLDCIGYDTCFLIDHAQNGPFDWHAHGRPVATLASGFTGIKMDVYSDQQAIQIYSCNGQNGSLALKKTQGLTDVPNRPRVVERHGCVALEVEDWIDALNHPEWQRERRHIFGPDDDPYVMQALHKFTVDGRK